MARPTKWRRIEKIPSVIYYIPSKKNIEKGPRNILKIEELEAIRLKDLEGLEQGECAKKMEVSRPTFQRILTIGREKIADSLVNGKIIHIEGGNFTRNICTINCLTCKREWIDTYENIGLVKNGQYLCPHCGSAKINCKESCQGKMGRGNCWRHGRGNK